MNTLKYICLTISITTTIIFKAVETVEITDAQHIRIPVICEMIHERTYFILRLEKLITALQKAEQMGLPPLQTIPSSLFTHERIKHIITHINAHQSFADFFKLWHELVEFRHIKDKELGRDFTRLNLAILKQLSSHTYTRDLAAIYRQDEITELVFFLDKSSFTEVLTVRNYYAERLKKSIEFLSTIRCKKDIAFETTTQNADCFCAFESHYIFKSPDILNCIQKINTTNSLESVITLGKDFTKYKLIQNDNFTKEFILFIFCIYKNLLHNNAIINNTPLTKSTIEVIAHLYENLDSLPLEEILDALDMLSEELPKLLEEYEFTSAMKWKDWLKKYWWAPPFIGATLILKTLLIIKTPKPAPKP